MQMQWWYAEKGIKERCVYQGCPLIIWHLLYAAQGYRIVPLGVDLTVKPVVCRVGHALLAGTDDRTSLADTTGRDDAVDQAQPIGKPLVAFVEVQPCSGASSEDALVGRGRRLYFTCFDDARFESSGFEVEHGRAKGVKVVLAKELDGREALELYTFGLVGEGFLWVDAIFGPCLLVQG